MANRLKFDITNMLQVTHSKLTTLCFIYTRVRSPLRLLYKTDFKSRIVFVSTTTWPMFKMLHSHTHKHTHTNNRGNRTVVEKQSEIKPEQNIE